MLLQKYHPATTWQTIQSVAKISLIIGLYSNSCTSTLILVQTDMIIAKIKFKTNLWHYSIKMLIQAEIFNCRSSLINYLDLRKTSVK